MDYDLTLEENVHWNTLELHEYQIVRNSETATIMYLNLVCPFCHNSMQLCLDPQISPIYFTIDKNGKISPSVICPFHGDTTIDIHIQLNNWGKYNA